MKNVILDVAAAARTVCKVRADLHPNLARIASRYDYVIRQLNAGSLTPDTAREHLLELQARDDHGIVWRINPTSGQFERRTAMGDSWVPDTPPSFGLATVDPFQVSDTARDDNPEFTTSTREVDTSYSPAFGLAGVTSAVNPDPQDMRTPVDETKELGDARKVTAVLGVLFGLVLVALVVYAVTALPGA